MPFRAEDRSKALQIGANQRPDFGCSLLDFEEEILPRTSCREHQQVAIASFDPLCEQPPKLTGQG